MPKHLVHIHSVQTADGQPKLPEPSMLNYGEIAINYATDHETISFKNQNDEIATFKTHKLYTQLLGDKQDKTDDSLTTQDKTIVGALNELKTDLDDSVEPYVVNLTNLLSANDSESISAAIGGIQNLNSTISRNQVIFGVLATGTVAVGIRVFGNQTTLNYFVDSVLGLTINEITITNTDNTLSKKVETHAVLTENMVINSLTSDETTLPLSAAQGKALDSKISSIDVSADITNAINALDSSGQTASTGEVISSVSQENGIISVQKKTLAENDIPTLSIAKISDLQTSLDAKQDNLTAGTGLEITEGNVINVTLDTTVFFVAETVPVSPSEDQKKKICLVPADTTEEGNFYTEYVWVVDDTHPDGYWEEFGTYKSEVDLTDYLKTSDAESTYQKITDDTLNTTSKTIVGAINEVRETLNSNKAYIINLTPIMLHAGSIVSKDVVDWDNLVTAVQNRVPIQATQIMEGISDVMLYDLQALLYQSSDTPTVIFRMDGNGIDYSVILQLQSDSTNVKITAEEKKLTLDVTTLFADSATITSGLSSQIAAYGESTATDFPLMYAGASIGNIKPTWIRTNAGVTNFMCIADNKIWYFEIQGTTVQRASLAIS